MRRVINTRLTAQYNKLSTFGVELWRVGLVKREKLTTDGIVSGLEVRGDLAHPLECLEQAGNLKIDITAPNKLRGQELGRISPWLQRPSPSLSSTVDALSCSFGYS